MISSYRQRSISVRPVLPNADVRRASSAPSAVQVPKATAAHFWHPRVCLFPAPLLKTLGVVGMWTGLSSQFFPHTQVSYNLGVDFYVGLTLFLAGRALHRWHKPTDHFHRHYLPALLKARAELIERYWRLRSESPHHKQLLNILRQTLRIGSSDIAAHLTDVYAGGDPTSLREIDEIAVNIFAQRELLDLHLWFASQPPSEAMSTALNTHTTIHSLPQYERLRLLFYKAAHTSRAPATIAKPKPLQLTPPHSASHRWDWRICTTGSTFLASAIALIGNDNLFWVFSPSTKVAAQVMCSAAAFLFILLTKPMRHD